MSADNRILQEQLQMKLSENVELQASVTLLKQQLSSSSDEGGKSVHSMCRNCSAKLSVENGDMSENLPPSTSGSPCISERKDSDIETSLRTQVLMQAAEIENLKQEIVRFAEEKDGLEIHSQKLSEEASYAKELAAAAAVELRNLAEEVTKLSYQNVKLTGDLVASKELSVSRSSNGYLKKSEESFRIEELKKEIVARCQREASLEAALSEKDRKEAELLRRIDESKQHEEDLESELANMWLLVAKLKRNGIVSNETLSEELNGIDFRQNGFSSSNGSSGAKFRGTKVFDGVHNDDINSFEEVTAAYEYERRRCEELEGIVSRLKGEDLDGLDTRALEELQSFHVDALSKICQEKLSNRVL